MSARRSTAENPRSSSVTAATPTLTVTTTSSSASLSGVYDTDKISFATWRTSRNVGRWTNTANSSPPKRANTSSLPSTSHTRSAKRISTSSPTWWPSGPTARERRCPSDVDAVESVAHCQAPRHHEQPTFVVNPGCDRHPVVVEQLDLSVSSSDQPHYFVQTRLGNDVRVEVVAPLTHLGEEQRGDGDPRQRMERTVPSGPPPEQSFEGE